MSTNSDPVCYGCFQFATISIACTKCDHICCLNCFEATSNQQNNNNSSSDSEDGEYEKLSEWVCSGCLTVDDKGGDKEPLVVLPTVAKSESSVLEVSSEDPLLFIVEDPSTESKPEDQSSDSEEPTVESLSTSEEPLPTSNISTEALTNPEQHSTEPLPMANEPSSEPPSTREDTPTESVELKQERCPLHDKEWKLYCLTCEQLICENCFLIGGSHMRHLIDYVKVIYQERRAKTEQKLEQLEAKLQVLQENAVQCEINLEMVRDAKQSVYDEIDVICMKAKQSVAKLTDGRIEQLQTQSDLPAMAQKLNDSLQEMVQQLSAVEFLKQQSQVDKRCDEMLGESVPDKFIFERFDDIGCELVPPYEMRICRGTKCFAPSAFKSYEQEITVCETRWTIGIYKKDSLFVKIVPHSKEILKFPFKLFVVISHRHNLQKIIRKSFTIQGTFEELEIASNDQLETNGFLKLFETIVMIGLRPLNALVEKELMIQQISDTKKKLADSTIRTCKKYTDLESCVQAIIKSNGFCFMYFNVNLYKQQNASYVHSTDLTGRTDHRWCLRVYQLDRSDTKADLQAYIVLRKGAPIKCQCFVELMHKDPKKTIHEHLEYKFDKIDSGFGWRDFIERRHLLSDPGFYPDEMLCFRFGVLPIMD